MTRDRITWIVLQILAVAAGIGFATWLFESVTR
jgi:hypothetical protein